MSTSPVRSFSVPLVDPPVPILLPLQCPSSYSTRSALVAGRERRKHAILRSMADEVVRLTGHDEPALEALLARDPIVNLFLIGFLAAHPAERTWWYGLGRPLR